MREQATILCGCKFIRTISTVPTDEIDWEIDPCSHHEGVETLTPMQLARFIDAWPPSEYAVERAWLRTRRSQTP